MMRHLLATLAGVLSVVLFAGPAPAQDKSTRVKVTTVDGVELMGQFYPSSKRNAPVAIMLHGLDSDSRKKDWVSLAEALQKAGIAVMTFDFRGHGDSTALSDPTLFWSQPANRSGIKNYKPTRDTIEAKDFKPEYRSCLANDIAAVKAFLDRKNDNNECNTGATILIGADEGSTLGAIWLNSEFYRFRMVEKMTGFMGRILVPNEHPEGRDVCACVWLGIPSKLGAGAGAFSVGKTLFLPGRTNATPMVFLHGSADEVGKAQATSLVNYLKDPKASKDKYKWTLPYEVKGSKLTGAGLLKSPGTIAAISDSLGEVILAKAQEWYDRDFRKTAYFWLAPGKKDLLRTPPTEMNMRFDTYYKFMQR